MLIRFLIAALLFFVCCASTAFAEVTADHCTPTLTADEADAKEMQRLAELNASLAQQASIMQTTEYGDDELKAYLETMMWLVVLAKSHVNGGFDEGIHYTNQDLTRLVEMGVMDSWPLNPLNDWNPLIVSDDITAVGPGDILFELCPEAYISMDDPQLGMQSFNMYLIGGEGLELDFPEPVIYAENREWALVPYSSIYGLSYYSLSRKKYWETQEWLASEGKPNLLHTRD